MLNDFKKLIIGVDCPDQFNEKIEDIEISCIFNSRKTLPRAIITHVEVDPEGKCFQVTVLVAEKSLDRFHLDTEFVSVKKGLFKKAVVLKMKAVVDPLIVKKEEN